MTDPSVKKEILKELIRRLHQGADPEEIRKQFQATFHDVGPTEIAQAEEELIKEGMPIEEVHKFCDVHIAAMKDSLEKGEVIAPEGHPIHTLMEEHKLLVGFSEELKSAVNTIKDATDWDTISDDVQRIKEIVQHFRDSENHYLREENVLFPFLEKHGITQPPAIMWMEHDSIRGIEKALFSLMDENETKAVSDFVKQLDQLTISLAETLASHFYKENNILFPTGMRVISDEEWQDISAQFADIGYCPFSPVSAQEGTGTSEIDTQTTLREGMVSFETGALSMEVLEVLFSSLPIDITFVDSEDTVRFFSESAKRIFVRTKAVIGRKVQQCHPEKSMHMVNQILEGFHSGERDNAEFWINVNDRLINIRYFPLRNSKGEYLGCIEVTQDITDIKNIQGEKRLLDG